MKNLLFVVVFTLFLQFENVASKSNPQGYLVNEYFEFADCVGKSTAKIALAIGVCVNSGMMGTPWINRYFIYTVDNHGDILANEYGVDPTCTTGPYGQALIQINACAAAGNAIYSTISATLPEFTIEYPIVEQTLYNYTGNQNQNQSTCEEEDYVVMYHALFRDMCQFDCGAGDGSCIFTSCVNNTANLTYSKSYSDDYNEDSCSMEYRGTELLTDSCSQNITCYAGGDGTDDDHNDDNHNNANSNDDDEDELSAGAIAGVVIAVLVVVGLVVGLVASKLFPKKPNHDVSNQLL